MGHALRLWLELTAFACDFGNVGDAGVERPASVAVPCERWSAHGHDCRQEEDNTCAVYLSYPLLSLARLHHRDNR